MAMFEDQAVRWLHVSVDDAQCGAAALPPSTGGLLRGSPAPHPCWPRVHLLERRAEREGHEDRRLLVWSHLPSHLWLQRPVLQAADPELLEVPEERLTQLRPPQPPQDLAKAAAREEPVPHRAAGTPLEA